LVSNFAFRNFNLRPSITELNDKATNLEVEMRHNLGQVFTLRTENTELRTENTELKGQLTRLKEFNSQNPAADGPTMSSADCW
jgi:regulator of replication initiation timing